MVVLNACALDALEQGRCGHKQITESAWESDVFVGSSLMDMYAKCGSMEYVGECATLKCGHLECQ